MKVAMGNDHGAVEYKDAIKAMLEKKVLKLLIVERTPRIVVIIQIMPKKLLT